MYCGLNLPKLKEESSKDPSEEEKGKPDSTPTPTAPPGPSPSSEPTPLNPGTAGLSGGRSPPETMEVTITTTVPGFQEFKFTPQLFEDPSTYDKRKRPKNRVIRLNPTILLTQKAIDAAPEEPDDLRKKQFFDRALFLTLNNRAATESPFGVDELSLKESVKKHVVEQNIKLTLDNLFKKGTVVYLGKEPYTIFHAEFTDTEWALLPKQDIDAVFTPTTVFDARIMNIQDKAGIEELKELDDDLKRGPDGKEVYGDVPIKHKEKVPKSKGTIAVPDKGLKAQYFQIKVSKAQ